MYGALFLACVTSVHGHTFLGQLGLGPYRQSDALFASIASVSAYMVSACAVQPVLYFALFWHGCQRVTMQLVPYAGCRGVPSSIFNTIHSL
jgi:hypothetical protein